MTTRIYFSSWLLRLADFSTCKDIWLFIATFIPSIWIRTAVDFIFRLESHAIKLVRRPSFVHVVRSCAVWILFKIALLAFFGLSLQSSSCKGVWLASVILNFC